MKIGRLWCSTSDTHNYDRNPKRGYCQLGRRDSILERRKARTTGGNGVTVLPSAKNLLLQARTAQIKNDYKLQVQAMRAALSNAPHIPKQGKTN